MSTAWLFLILAIIVEVLATLCLRLAAHGSRRWYVPVVVGYTSAFSLFSVSLYHGMGLGVAYGIWTAVGVALTAIAAWMLFQEKLSGIMILGFVFIISGVVMLELGTPH